MLICAVAEVRQFYKLDDTGQTLVKAAMTQLQLSARAYRPILILARTIADLAVEKSTCDPPHSLKRKSY
ncbi:MAG: hypothetical protein HN390_08455 [Anaerolineae bacterium]|jgi:predicted ATPase with chaperone activity|nr:hypothetical protein [Anaerolineae bacterium]MBT7191796.1 hypothetical protein [Anaerolineae bacterium]MBT7991980.1 hypothetical protein [Anaerolineae bacterium]